MTDLGEIPAINPDYKTELAKNDGCGLADKFGGFSLDEMKTELAVLRNQSNELFLSQYPGPDSPTNFFSAPDLVGKWIGQYLGHDKVQTVEQRTMANGMTKSSFSVFDKGMFLFKNDYDHGTGKLVGSHCTTVQAAEPYRPYFEWRTKR